MKKQKKNFVDKMSGSTAESISENEEDTFNYKGWLVSDKFSRRMWAVVGYGFVGTLIIYAVILILGILFGIIIAIFE